MTQLVCNYATIRFLPYRESGEFVNVGVVLSCPEIDFFDFTLVKRRSRRIKGFFPELDPTIFAAGAKALERELASWRNSAGLYTEAKPFSDANALRAVEAFSRLLMRKESMLHFAEVGSLIADNPQDTLRKLNDEFVNRRFAQDPKYQETVMQDRLGQFLREWGLGKAYKRNQRIGNDLFNIRLPFVHFEQKRPSKAIKPLDLDRTSTTDIYEHGDAWVQKLRRLRGQDVLTERLIVAVNLPTVQPHVGVAEEIVQAFRDDGVRVVPFERTDDLRREARV